MGLRDYADAGVADLLEGAADVILERGLAKGIRLNPANGSVDLVAALALAGGADPKSLNSSRSMFDTGVSAVHEAALLVSVDVLEAELGIDLEEWSDSPRVGTREVAHLLRKTATRLRIAIT